MAVTSGAGYTEFAFDVAPGEPACITFHFRLTTFGHREGHVTADGAPPLAINHYIYP